MPEGESIPTHAHRRCQPVSLPRTRDCILLPLPTARDGRVRSPESAAELKLPVGHDHIPVNSWPRRRSPVRSCI